MTAPLCHGTAGGRIDDVRGPHFTWHATTCPHKMALPAKRTMGQCSEECQRYSVAPICGTALPGHLSTCPAIYPLQRQPGDETDALTRLTAHLREEFGDGDREQTSSENSALYVALDLISEARDVMNAAATWRTVEASSLRAAREEWTAERSRLCTLLDAFAADERALRADLANTHANSEVREARARRLEQDLTSAKALVTTLSSKQSEVRQRAFRDMAAEMEHMGGGAKDAHIRRILDEAKEF
jgi:hypothetical protein